MRAAPFFLACITFALGIAAGVVMTTIAPPQPADKTASVPQAASADLTDLVQRLYPLTKCATSGYSWCRDDAQVCISAEGVALKLKIADRAYDIRATTVAGAVASLVEPSPDLRRALEGWKQP